MGQASLIKSEVLGAGVAAQGLLKGDADDTDILAKTSPASLTAAAAASLAMEAIRTSTTRRARLGGLDDAPIRTASAHATWL